MNTFFTLIKDQNAFQQLKFKGAFIVRIEGSCCRTSEELYNTLQSQFEFPDYFGKNLDALYDCLVDLEWITQDRIVVLISQFDQLLEAESADPELLEDFLLTLNDASISWQMNEEALRTSKSLLVYIMHSEKSEQMLADNGIDFETI